MNDDYRARRLGCALPPVALLLLLLLLGCGAEASQGSAEPKAVAARAVRSVDAPAMAPRMASPAKATPVVIAPVQAKLPADDVVVLRAPPKAAPPQAADVDSSGVVVTVAAGAEGTGSASVGHPRMGSLHRGVKLEQGKGFRIGWPDRAWATEDTIYDLLDIIDAVRRVHPKAHDVLIGDLSSKQGGPLSGHASHQSGRDVDIGFYFEDAPTGGLSRFPHFDKGAFDVATTWTLLRAVIGPDVSKPRVKRVFLAWATQEVLRRHAAKEGVDKATLDAIFQYPTGGGIVRHAEGHRGHLHVRFLCSPKDTRCTDQVPKSLTFHKAKRKCLKRKSSARAKASKLQQILAGVEPKKRRRRNKRESADVHCFMLEVE